jgi:predicted AAA+ superfamily ATPase
LAHPIAGVSWEGWAIEALLAVAPAGTEVFFYRTGAGAEIDLVLEWPGGKRWAVEFKRSLTPVLARGFHEGCKEIEPERKIVVYPGTESFPLGNDVEAMSLIQAMTFVRGAR